MRPWRADPRLILRSHIEKQGLRASRKRDLVARVFFATGGHVSVEELLAKAREIDPRIGQATVYRTLKLLQECGLATARHFAARETLYELGDISRHHDHLICNECGAIKEFVNQRIEALQQEVAEAHGFAVSAHRLEIYGLCKSCRTRKP